MDKRLVVASDFQAPFHLPQCLSLLCAFNRDFKPDTLVLNGDLCDLASITHFTKSQRLTPSTVAQEVAICFAEVLVPALESLGWEIGYTVKEFEAPGYGIRIPRITVTKVKRGKAKVYWTQGNHEYRLERYIFAYAPAFEGLVTFEELFHLDELGVEFVRGKGTSGNGVLRLTSKLTICHGERHGMNPAKLTLMDWGGSIIVGHAHKESSWRQTFPSGIDWVGMASGCMCKDGEWKAFSPYNRGFIAGAYDETSGDFSVDHMRISGDDWTKLYTPYGRYHARKDGHGYKASRVR